jgi:hypothetical protein
VDVLRSGMGRGIVPGFPAFGTVVPGSEGQIEDDDEDEKERQE